MTRLTVTEDGRRYDVEAFTASGGRNLVHVYICGSHAGWGPWTPDGLKCGPIVCPTGYVAPDAVHVAIEAAVRAACPEFAA